MYLICQIFLSYSHNMLFKEHSESRVHTHILEVQIYHSKTALFCEFIWRHLPACRINDESNHAQIEEHLTDSCNFSHIVSNFVSSSAASFATFFYHMNKIIYICIKKSVDNWSQEMK